MSSYLCHLLPAFDMFNYVWALFPNADVDIFLTTVSVMSQCLVLVSVPKWQCCRFPNNCISDDTTVFGSVPKCGCCHFFNTCINDDTTVFGSVPKWRKTMSSYLCHLLPAFDMFNYVWALFPNADVDIFLTTVSVMSQCLVLVSVPKWQCCRFPNNCISDDTTVFGSVPKCRCCHFF